MTVSEQEYKSGTPSGQKIGDRKGAVHAHPAKKAGKTPATSKKWPKSGGSVTSYYVEMSILFS